MRPPQRPELRADLLRRAEQDQQARTAALKAEPDWEAVSAVDAANVAWLKDVVAEDGPDRREAGDERPPVDPPADRRSRLPGQAVPEHERPHADSP